MDDLPSIRLLFEYESAAIHRVAVDQMESDQRHVLRQFLNA